jgi:predicted Zn finger-like uncharacterized protein
VLIRCEKCSTVYELDEKVLPKGGAPVQCSRCQYIFTAYPTHGAIPSAPAPAPEPPPSSNAPGEPTRETDPAPIGSAETASDAPREIPRTPVPSQVPGSDPSGAHSPTPVPSPPRSPAPQVAAVGAGVSSGAGAGIGAAGAAAPPPASAPLTNAPAAGTSSSARTAHGSGEPQFTADGRPIRKVPFPDDDPAPAGPRTFARPVSVPSSRPRSGSFVRWAVVMAILAAAAAAIAAWRLGAHKVSHEAVQRRAEGHSLLLRDDRTSLARAVVLFEDAARIEPGLFQARADRALAHALLLGFVEAEAARLAVRAEALERLGAGADDPARATAAADAAHVLGVLEAARARARQLEDDVARDLAPLLREHGRDLAVLRADALLTAFGQAPARTAETVKRARAAGLHDPWIDLAEAAADARADTPERRAEGAARAEVVAQAHPDMLRARFIVASSLARADRVQDAIAAADSVLSANPAHDDARALKVELLAAPPSPPPPPLPAPVGESAPAGASPAGTEGLLPRKTLSHADAALGR